eukprot:4312691-Prymnesium_polylepis.1
MAPAQRAHRGHPNVSLSWSPGAPNFVDSPAQMARCVNSKPAAMSIMGGARNDSDDAELRAAQQEIRRLLLDIRGARCKQALPWFVSRSGTNGTLKNFGDEFNTDIGGALLGIGALQ